MSEVDLARVAARAYSPDYKLTVIVEWGGVTYTLDRASIEEADMQLSWETRWGKPVRIAELRIKSRIDAPATLAQKPVDAGKDGE